MPRKKSRVVIDTNIWVSFLIGKVLSGLEDLIIDNRIQILLSDELFCALAKFNLNRKLGVPV
ncbi:MAG: putative toxin-antitoxin system toxin component, PIN family [bacterium]